MKKLFYFLLSLLAFVGCTESETDNTNNNQGGGNTEPSKTELTVNVTDLVFDAEADVKTIDISSSDAWIAEFVNDRASEWCTLSPKSGQAGNNSILVNVTENNSGEERSASVIIKAKSLQKVVKITQKQNDAITVTSSKFEVKAEGGEVEIEIKANVDYEYSIEESAKSWVTYKTTRAMESSTLVFDVAENSNIEKREAKITFKGGDLKEVVTIYQEGTEYAIIISKNEYTVSDKGETIAVEVKSNVDVAVEIPSDVDWVKENNTRAMSTNTYYFEVLPNDGYNSRSTEIKFTNKANNLSETVTISQAQKDAIVIAKDSYTVNYSGGEIDIEVGHNVDFDIEISDSWITKTSTRAFETETLTFTVAANNSNDSREGTIKFTSKDKSITQTVTINQGTRLPANNEIFYTSSNGHIIEPNVDDCFGANIVSNVYENGMGIITFDKEVTSIGDIAFYRSDRLTRITLPNSVTKIGDRAFNDCDCLINVIIPDSVTAIGYKAFENCNSLASVTIGNGVTAIGESAFSVCISLASVTIGNSVTTIGKSAFGACWSLTNVVIGNNVTTIGKSAFYGCRSLTSITIPDSVTEIGEQAFSECQSLTSITIPDSVTEIGEEAFCDCDSLKTFYGKFATADNRALIVNGVLNAFAIGCGATSYTIPDSVTEIGKCAFYYCSSLTSITIPDSVTEIGEVAFCECSSLTSITIPDSVTVIEFNTFNSCSNLEIVSMPEGLISIEFGAFEDCTSLKSVTIPASVKTIGAKAFYGCDKLIIANCKAITPPEVIENLSYNSYIFSSVTARIYVPQESVNAYKNAYIWKNYSKAITGYDFNE